MMKGALSWGTLVEIIPPPRGIVNQPVLYDPLLLSGAAGIVETAPIFDNTPVVSLES